MKTGSLVNHLAISSKDEFAMPEVGTGVTAYYWSDRSAGTVTAIIDVEKKIIEVKGDKAIRIDNNGTSESQEYRFELDPDSTPMYFRWDAKKSKWRLIDKNDKGRWVLRGEMNIKIGHRSHYYDFSF